MSQGSSKGSQGPVQSPIEFAGPGSKCAESPLPDLGVGGAGGNPPTTDGVLDIRNAPYLFTCYPSPNPSPGQHFRLLRGGGGGKCRKGRFWGVGGRWLPVLFFVSQFNTCTTLSVFSRLILGA